MLMTLILFLYLCLVSVQARVNETQTATTVYTEALVVPRLSRIRAKGAGFLHPSSIIHCSLSSWKGMLGCDMAQEEADKKQVAQAVTDTEGDSDKRNIEFPPVLPNVEGCLYLLVGIFMHCRVYEATRTNKLGELGVPFGVLSLNTQQ